MNIVLACIYSHTRPDFLGQKHTLSCITMYCRPACVYLCVCVCVRLYSLWCSSLLFLPASHFGSIRLYLFICLFRPLCSFVSLKNSMRAIGRLQYITIQ